MRDSSFKLVGLGAALVPCLLAIAAGCGVTDPLGGGGSCRVGDRIYRDGTEFADRDGCNTCFCEDGTVQCTLMACPQPRPCGGLAGSSCRPDEYCADQPSCGIADGSGVCRPRPEQCPELWAPVCACDGKTYSSACVAASNGLGIRHEGECDGGQPKACGGRLGDTCTKNEYCAYENGDCGHADGTALCQARPDACDAVYDPVCGCDGKTYGNACQAALAGHGWLQKGECDGSSGGSCVIGGTRYPDGTTGIPAPDGCNTCSCSNGKGSCTERACPASSCIVNGQVYAHGSAGVPDPRSCNQCSCSNGSVGGCTEMHCPLPGAPCQVGRAIYQHDKGFVSGDGSISCSCNDGNMRCAAVP